MTQPRPSLNPPGKAPGDIAEQPKRIHDHGKSNKLIIVRLGRLARNVAYDGCHVFAIVRSSRPFKGRAECADNSLSEGPRFAARVSDGSNVGTNINAIFNRDI